MGEKKDFSSSHVAKYKATHNLKHYQTGKAFSFVPSPYGRRRRRKSYLKKYVKLEGLEMRPCESSIVVVCTYVRVKITLGMGMTSLIHSLLLRWRFYRLGYRDNLRIMWTDKWARSKRLTKNLHQTASSTICKLIFRPTARIKLAPFQGFTSWSDHIINTRMDLFWDQRSHLSSKTTLWLCYITIWTNTSAGLTSGVTNTDNNYILLHLVWKSLL